jgi:type II secretory pathway pseudopilin PulG
LRGRAVAGSRGVQSRPNRETAQPRNRATAENGFTLAGVIVIMTIMMIFVAYTVPRQWSTIMKRERERETIYAMQQYAKAITEFRLKNNTYPTSPQQLKDARMPRMIRGLKGELADPLTGEVDWLVIPQSAGAALPQHNIVNPNGNGSPPPTTPGTQTTSTTSSTTDTSSSSTTSTSGTNPNAPPALPGIPIKDYAGGPFIGVRPPTHGKSLISLFGADTYETWIYTTLDYEQEKALRITGASTVFH